MISVNTVSYLNGKEYRYVETVIALDTSAQMIVCTDKDGNKFVCSNELWEKGAPATAMVSATSTTREKIALFMSLFRGREDVFARRYHNLKTGQEGYTQVCRNAWDPQFCNHKLHKCGECPNRDFIPLSAEIIRSHLIGKDRHCRDVVGLYPLLPDNTTWLLAIDLDEADWKADVSAFRETCKEYDIVPAVERSRSGNGAHIWFFFSEPVPAAEARRFGSGLITRTMSRRHELKFRSYDRLFPSQDIMPKGGFGNLIALPFQGQAQKNGNSLFIDEQLNTYSDQWAYLSSIPKITPEQLTEYCTELCKDGDTGPLVDLGDSGIPAGRRKAKDMNLEDFPTEVRIIMSNLLFIDKTGFSQAALNAIKRLAAFRNPDYYKAQAMRLRIYNIPRVIDCGEEYPNKLALPRGCLDPLTELLHSYNVPYRLFDQRFPGRKIDVSFHGQLRPEQQPAADALLGNDIGVLSATTAFGKTVIGAYLIGQRKVNTLVLVHTSALLEQWKTALGKFLEIRESLPEQPKKRGRKKQQHLIGQLGSGKHTLSGIVDIAIMQSLFQGDDKEVKSLVTDYGMIICDECHHVAAFSFEKILKTARAKYVYGLSATPTRQDGHQPIIFMQCGPVRYLVDAKAQAEKREFDHFVISRLTRLRLPNVDSVQSAYAKIADNEARNKLILSDAVSLLREGRTPIILTERKEHAVFLAEALKEEGRHVFLLLGSDKQKEKRGKLEELRSVSPSEPLVIVATGKYIGEGFDEPRLDTMLLAMPVSWKGTLAQYAGRLHRNYEGKTEVRIYDYADLHVPMLERMYRKRLKGYSELGYSIKAGEKDDTPGTVFTGQNFFGPFSADLSEAGQSIVLVSPTIRKNRIAAIVTLLEKAASSGVNVTIYTRPSDEYSQEQQESVNAAISLMESKGMTIVARKGLSQRYAVVDQRIVWYGNIDFLAFSRHDANAIRFENTDIAGELLDICKEENNNQFIK